MNISNNKKIITFWSIISVVLFSITNTLSYLFQSTTLNTGALIRSVVFMIVLYLWGLTRLFSQKKFAVSFMYFILFVYLIGFISTIIVSATYIHGINTLIVIGLSILGLVVNSIIFWIIRKNNSQSVTN